MPAAIGLHPDVVSCPIQILLAVHVAVRLPLIRRASSRRRLPILRMKVKLVRSQRLAVSPVVDVEVKRISLDRAFVRYRNPRVLLKRHGKEAIQRLVRTDLQRRRLIRVILAQPEPVKVADRSLYTRGGLAIPIHAQNQRLQMIRIITSNRDPYMRNDSGASVIQQSQRLPRSNRARIGIPS